MPMLSRILTSCLIAWGCFVTMHCASDKGIAPENASVTLAIAATNPVFVIRYENDSTRIHLEKAQVNVGEIGIHWSRILAQSEKGPTVLAPKGLAKSMHDVPGGKISPKIYRYYALDLLNSVDIQSLAVGPALYDHVHMVMRPADDSSIHAPDGPLLRGLSLLLAGRFERGGISRPFRIALTDTLKENGFGDVLFQLEVRAEEAYRIRLKAKVETWLNDLTPSDLPTQSKDTLVIRSEDKSGIATKIRARLASDNPFDIEVKKL